MAQPVDKLKIALLQLLKATKKEQNVKNVMEKIRQVVKDYTVKVVCLPEIWMCPTYDLNSFPDCAEQCPGGPICQQLCKLAKELNIYIVCGSMIEKDGNKLYNTCCVWGPQGNLLGKHRKVHLFDINMDKLQMRESDVLTPGNDFTMVNIEGRNVGICICNDMRFEEFARVYRNLGCEVLMCPAAANVMLGELMWDIMMRGRANDNQVYVCGISSARDETDKMYTLYGHSMVVDPWGQVLAEASEKEEIVIAELDFNKLQKMRQQVPLQEQRRTDIYDTIRKK